MLTKVDFWLTAPFTWRHDNWECRASQLSRRREGDAKMTSRNSGDGDKREWSDDDVVVKATDIAQQLGTLLESRKLDPQTVPFSGFDSPPGRF